MFHENEYFVTQKFSMSDFDHLDRTKPAFYKLKPTQGVFYETAMAWVFRHNPLRKCRIHIGEQILENGMLTPDTEGNCWVSFPGKPDGLLVYSADKPDDYGDNQKYTGITIFVEDDHEQFIPAEELPNEGKLIGSTSMYIPEEIIEKVLRLGPVTRTMAKVMFFIMQVLFCSIVVALAVHGHTWWACLVFCAYGILERWHGKALAYIDLILKMKNK